MTKPDAVTAYKYGDKTFPTMKEAVQEEFKDKFIGFLGGRGTTAASQFETYCWPKLKDSMEDLVEATNDYDSFINNNSHPTIQAAQQSPGYDW